MMESKWERRITNVFVALVLAVFALAGPAGATPKNDSGAHKVTICHYTHSQTNPYVVITVDVAAFDGLGHNDHTLHGDLEYIDGECGGGTGGTSG